MKIKKIKMGVVEKIEPATGAEPYPRIQRKKEVWPESDSDGYPTEQTLKYIKEWHVPNKKDCKELLEFCIEAWKYEDYAFEKNGQYIFQTGGWSGNEDIISTMNENTIFWMLCWYSSRRGGHYKFVVEK